MVDFPQDLTLRISQETIYQALYIQGRSEAGALGLPALWPSIAFYPGNVRGTEVSPLSRTHC